MPFVVMQNFVQAEDARLIGPVLEATGQWERWERAMKRSLTAFPQHQPRQRLVKRSFLLIVQYSCINYPFAEPTDSLLMPKEGPKKFTKRDEREAERKAKRAELQRAKTKAGLQPKVLNEYNMKSNPNLPTTKCERRALRAALAAEGISMTVWNSRADLSAFRDIARERFVNRKYAIPVEDQDNDFEHDPWLQMYLHVPEQYREDIPSKDTLKSVSVPAPEHAPRAKPIKMSRRQAKEAAERRAAMQNGTHTLLLSTPASASASADGDGEVVIVTPAEVPSPRDTTDATPTTPLSHTSLSFPTGGVAIYGRDHFTLCADSGGALKWAKFPPGSEGNIWTLQPAKDGKYTLRSRHGKYLSHCLLWGLVANRAAASDWELLTLAPAAVPAKGAVVNDGRAEDKAEEGVLCTIQTWRGSYLCAAPSTITNPAAATTVAVERGVVAEASLGSTAVLRIVAVPFQQS